MDFGGNGSKHAFVATAILPGWSGVVGLASQRIDPVAQDADFLADKLIEFIEHPRVTLPEQIRVSGKLLDGGSVRSL